MFCNELLKILKRWQELQWGKLLFLRLSLAISSLLMVSALCDSITLVGYCCGGFGEEEGIIPTSIEGTVSLDFGDNSFSCAMVF